MSATPSDIDTLDKPEQVSKASFPIETTLEGIVTLDKTTTILVFATRFISITCMLNGRKVMTQVLLM